MLHDAWYNMRMANNHTQNPAAGGTSIINVRDLKPGMKFHHTYGRVMEVGTIEDTSSPAWARAASDPGHFTVTCPDGYQLTIPRGNTVRIEVAA